MLSRWPVVRIFLTALGFVETKWDTEGEVGKKARACDGAATRTCLPSANIALMNSLSAQDPYTSAQKHTDSWYLKRSRTISCLTELDRD